MTNYRFSSTKERKEARTMYEFEGLTYFAIGRKTNRGTTTIRNWGRVENWDQPRKDNKKRDEAWHLLVNGSKIGYISEQLGVSRGTLWRWGIRKKKLTDKKVDKGI